MKTRALFQSHSSLKLILLLTALVGIFLIVGCGGSSSPAPITPTENTSSLQVNLGDAPADWIVAFSMNISSMMLTNSSGSTVSVASGPMQMEMRHLMGTMQPLAMINVPRGTYSVATMVINSATVTYMDPVTKLPVQQTMAGMTKTINFNPPVTIGPTPMTMTFDLDLSQSISSSGGNMVFNPIFTMMTGAPGGGTGPQFGGMDDMVGSVSGVSGSSFTMSMMQGLSSVTVMTNSSTQFEHLSGMGGMSSGMMVEVDATMQSDGSLMATRVDSVMGGMSGGIMAEGLLTSITGNPPMQLSIIADNGAGTGMMGSNLGRALQINVTNSTTYSFNNANVNLTNLPFTPAFNATAVAKGQRVDPESTGSMMPGGMPGGGNVINGTQITLEQQGLSGTVGSYASGSPASFVLTLPSDSAFTTITGAGTITVYQQPDCQLRGISSVVNGASVQVRGLLFFNAGTYKLVATTIMSH